MQDLLQQRRIWSRSTQRRAEAGRPTGVPPFALTAVLVPALLVGSLGGCRGRENEDKHTGAHSAHHFSFGHYAHDLEDWPRLPFEAPSAPGTLCMRKRRVKQIRGRR